jgi:iron complex transport system ATP-binding protein
MDCLRLKDVSWQRSGRQILEEINWRVGAGEHWALIGLNGAGKTSILNLINGYIWPSTGSVEVLGHTYGKIDVREVREHIGWVSASMADRIAVDRPNERVLDVVISGKYASVGVWTSVVDEDVNLAYAQLESLGCEHLAPRKLSECSQGERQKVLIARAMMSKLQLLILDEPCTGLDVKARESFLSTVRTLMQSSDGPTILYVSHHVEEIVPEVSHAVVLDQGRILTQGEKQEVITDDVLSRAFGVSVHIDWRENRPWLKVYTG